MVAIPAYCTHCGLVFRRHNLVALGGGAVVTMSDNVTSCPRCGHDAKIVDGSFDILNGTLQLISGPDITRDILASFRDLADRAQKNEISPEQAVVAATELNPILGDIMAQFMKIGLPILGLLVSLISLYLTVDGNTSSGEFQRELLQLERNQTDVLRRLERQSTQQSSEQRKSQEKIKSVRANPAKPKAEKQALVCRQASERRAKVNKQRREELLQRRRDFGGSRS